MIEGEQADADQMHPVEWIEMRRDAGATLLKVTEYLLWSLKICRPLPFNKAGCRSYPPLVGSGA